MKIGIFGGTFNPPHMGHLNSAQTAAKKLGLDKVLVIPANQNPLKHPVEGPSAEQRLEMVQKAFSSLGDQFVVDGREIEKGGKSYTAETLKSLEKDYPGADFFLIIGMDQLENLKNWKKVETILEKTNLVVTSRPGFHFPDSAEELPDFLKSFVAEMDFNFIEMTTGKSIQFLTLQDVDVTATELRKWLRVGKNVEKYLPLSVENYVKEKGLYKDLGKTISDFGKLAQFCANVLSEKKAIQIRGFDLREVAAPAEYTLIASGTSTKHAASLAENVASAVKEEFNVYPQSLEGSQEGRWVVLDYGPLIVHVFYDFVRQEYSLEKLWRGAKEISFPEQK